MTIIYEAADVQLRHGDVRAELRELEADSVNAVVTSPPYFGLRSYIGVALGIWGGDASCEHEWQTMVVPAANGLVNNAMQGETLSESSATRRPRESSTCKRCSAWRGLLGLEDTPARYIANLVDVFREVRRVLHPTGVCLVNLGDSFSSGTDTPRRQSSNNGVSRWQNGDTVMGNMRTTGGGLPAKNLLGMPFRVALALQADGWYWRSCIPWVKWQVAMPESITDRPRPPSTIG